MNKSVGRKTSVQLQQQTVVCHDLARKKKGGFFQEKKEKHDFEDTWFATFLFEIPETVKMSEKTWILTYCKNVGLRVNV